MENEMEPSEAAAKTFYEAVEDAEWDILAPETKLEWERAWAKAHEAYYKQYEARSQTIRKHRFV
jgi:hypothetical protein